jgi:hypothetical protein
MRFGEKLGQNPLHGSVSVTSHFGRPRIAPTMPLDIDIVLMHSQCFAKFLRINAGTFCDFDCGNGQHSSFPIV